MDSISIPGFAHLPSTMPSDLLEDRPSMPALNKLVAVETHKAGPGGEKVHVLCMPETIIKTWYQHPTCSESLNWIRRLRFVSGGLLRSARLCRQACETGGGVSDESVHWD